MALFKKLKYELNGVKTDFNVNVSPDGTFWCEPKRDLMDALGLTERIEEKSFDEVSYKLTDAVHKFNQLKTKVTYFIVYRITLSNRIKEQMPKSVMSDKEWKKTRGIGSEYMPQDEIGLILQWFPMVQEELGQTTIKYKMKPADQDDLDYVANYGDLFKDKLRKPYSDLLFFIEDRFWEEFNDGMYFKIPLTHETFTFFSQIEKNLVTMLTNMFAFLNQDPEKLMANISKAVENGGIMMLGAGKKTKKKNKN
jgi:hypothetical protein